MKSGQFKTSLFASFFILLIPIHAIDDKEVHSFINEINLMKNGSFEQGLTPPWGTGQYSGGKPIWWNSKGCQSKASISTKSFKKGKKSLFIHNPSSRRANVFGTMAQRISITPNKRYRLILWAGSRDLASAGAISVAVDSNWKVRPVVLPAGSMRWTRFDGTFSLPENFADIRILAEDKGKIWIDDIKVVPDLDLSVHKKQGKAWSGREGDGWDFVLYSPKSEKNGRIIYNYLGQHVSSGRAGTGIMIVTFFNRHMKAELIDDKGTICRGYDGTISKDGTFISGSSWPRPKSGPHGPKKYTWWATIKKNSPLKIPLSLDLNQASVASLEALGLSSRSARTVVEGRILATPYQSINEALGAPRLSLDEKIILMEHTVVK